MYDFELLNFQPAHTYRLCGHLRRCQSGTIIAKRSGNTGCLSVFGFWGWDSLYINFLFFILNFYDISDGLAKPGIFLEGGFKRILTNRRETPHLTIPNRGYLMCWQAL
jgi:hypothetical protein